MGRPRKQPRRIVTFNLNLPLADAIDEAMMKMPPKKRNRSEWMNRNLPTILEAAEDTAALRIDPAALISDIPDEELYDEAEARGIITRFTTKRRLLLALQAVREDLPDKKRLISDLERAMRDA
jgi:hypothetical protein